MKTVDKLGELVLQIRTIEDISEYRKLTPLWKEFFILAMEEEGIKGESVERLFKWGEHGYNWKALWRENTEFKDHTTEKLLESFQSETLYIYDRLSLDRIFRVHWLYQKVMIAGFELKALNETKHV